MRPVELAGNNDGVQAQAGAGTPSPFRPVESRAAIEALELDRVLELVAEHAAGPLGGASVRGRRPSGDPHWIRTELGMVAEVLALCHQGEGLDVPPVPELAGVLDRLRVAGSVSSWPELVAVGITLRAARVVAGELERLADRAPTAASLRVPLPHQRLERRLRDALDDTGELLDTASPQLAAARREVHVARERLIKKLETILRGLDSQAFPSGAQVTIRGDRYVIPVRRDSRARPEGIVHDESATQATLFVEPTAAIELGNALRAALIEAEREALRVLRDLTELCRPEAEALRAAHGMCVAADDLRARVRYADAVRGEAPVIGEPGGRVVLRNARHPLLLARGAAVVPFDLELGDAERTLLISGPNAGGKTVLLKTAGLAAQLAQSGVVPPLGPGSELPVFHRIVADIGDHQSISADLSTFSAHVAVLREALAAADPATLILVDEIGSGTDPAEGAALAGAALRVLTERGARTIATTHLGALKVLAEEVPGVVNGSLQFDAESLSPTFRFQKGTPGRSYGLAIARRLGISPDVLDRAEAELPARERALDRLLASVEAGAGEIAARSAELERRLGDLSQRAVLVAEREAALERQEQEIRQRQREAERSARQEARAHLLAARSQVEEALRRAQAGAGETAAREARRVLEDAVRAEADALAQAEAEPGAPHATAAPIALRQRVRLPSGAAGVVLELRPDGRALVGAGAVRLLVDSGSLTPVAGKFNDPAPVRPSAHMPNDVAAPLEIDLRGLRGEEAEAATVSALDAAILADHPFLRIIHGMGTGVVRERVRQVLKGDRRVAKFTFAPRNQGGTGVTLVEFRPGP